MEALTVTQVSKQCGVSARMLRYYENAGLIRSFRREDYAYRMYDPEAVTRLRQILLLRRLRIPLAQVKILLDNPHSQAALQVFQRNIAELDRELASLSAIRHILARLLTQLQEGAGLALPPLPDDAGMLAMLEALPPISINFKEDQVMKQAKTASPLSPVLTDVRILTLPPCTVASAHFVGDEPEVRANQAMDRFVREIRLTRRKADLRHYGFNHPNPMDESGAHGYEIWVTVPDDLEVPPPLTKKHFAGGLYAAHMIPMGNFHEWAWLMDWVEQSDRYEFAGDMQDQAHMCGLLEEHLNYAAQLEAGNAQPEEMQLDLLAPIREIQGYSHRTWKQAYE